MMTRRNEPDRWGDLMRASMILLLAAATLLTACNTVRGVGRDVQSVGEVVEKSTN